MKCSRVIFQSQRLGTVRPLQARHDEWLRWSVDDARVILDGEGDRSGQVSHRDRFWLYCSECTRPIRRGRWWGTLFLDGRQRYRRDLKVKKSIRGRQIWDFLWLLLNFLKKKPLLLRTLSRNRLFETKVR